MCFKDNDRLLLLREFGIYEWTEGKGALWIRVCARVCVCLCYNRLTEVMWIPPGDAVLSDTGSHGQHMHATLTAGMFARI